MTENAQKLFKLLFKEGESVCVSPSQYGFHSVPQEALLSPCVELVSNKKGFHVQVPIENLEMVSINPISGARNDENCTSFRNFLVEMDDMPLKEQAAYIADSGLPFSGLVFSGGKSYHFLICLDESLPDLDIYRFYSSWILEALDKADPSTKNPSRSTRIPDHLREGGSKQELLYCGESVTIGRLQAWLNGFERKRPVPKVNDWVPNPDFDFKYLHPKTRDQLFNGVDASNGRNNAWFMIGRDFGLKGCDLEAAMVFLREKFHPEHDFTSQEWQNTIESGYKYGARKRMESYGV